MQRVQCEICEAAAVYHETALEGELIFQRHFCEIHGDQIWLDILPWIDEESLDDFNAMLLEQFDADEDLDEPGVDQDEADQEIRDAMTLEELFAVLRRR